MTKINCGLLDISYLNLTSPPYCMCSLFVFYNYDMLTVAVTALKDIYNEIMVSFVYSNTVLFSV